MIPESKHFKIHFSGGFGMADSEPQFYIEACEEVPERLTGDERGTFHAFRDELAAHIRDSSFAPLPRSSQWMTNEWLRDIWFDAFGPEAPPGDPFPVPREDWGHTRLSDYMLHAVNVSAPDWNTAATLAWLEARGLTVADVDAAVDLSASRSVGYRNAPEGWLEHLKELTDRGLREPQPGEFPDS